MRNSMRNGQEGEEMYEYELSTRHSVFVSPFQIDELQLDERAAAVAITFQERRCWQH